MNLRALRLRAGMTQAELGQRCGRSQQFVAALEGSRPCNPSIRILNALADALALTGEERDGFVLGFVRAAQGSTMDTEQSFRCAGVAGEEAA